MTITINKDSFPRFTKRLKKSLQHKSIHLSHSEIQDIAAQSLGKENYYELNIILNKEVNHSTANNIIENTDNDLLSPTSEDNQQEQMNNSVLKRDKITLNLQEAYELIECFDGDLETEMTISRFKEDNNQLFAWFTDYPEEGRILLNSEISSKNLYKESNIVTDMVKEFSSLLNEWFINPKDSENSKNKIANLIDNFQEKLKKE